MRAFYCCNLCVIVIDAKEIDRSWSTHALSRRYRMSALDEITKEKQRISGALARIDAQREKLATHLSELDAAERGLARYTTGAQARKTFPAKAQTSEPEPAAQTRLHGGRRTTTAKPAGGKRTSPSLNDQVLA